MLITGCDTGFGHDLAVKLHNDLEFIVFAFCLDAESEGAARLISLGKDTGRLHVIKLDVTSQQQVEDVLRYVRNNLPELGLWGVVNNAGISNAGNVEWIPCEIYEKVIVL